MRTARAELAEFIQQLLRKSDLVLLIRNIELTSILVLTGTVTENADIQMQWSPRKYWSGIVSRERVAVIGWPDDIKFVNPFRLTGLNTIGRLSFLWRRGEIYFHRLSGEEFHEWKDILEPLAATARLASLLSRSPRSDIGDTRPLRPIATRSKNRRAQSTGLKSTRYIDKSSRAVIHL